MTRQAEEHKEQAPLHRDAPRTGSPHRAPCHMGGSAARSPRTPDQLQFENACFLAFHDRDPAVRAACRSMASRRMGLGRVPTLDELREADAALDALLGLDLWRRH